MAFSVKPTNHSRPLRKIGTATRRILRLALTGLIACTATTVALSQPPFGFPANESVPWASSPGMAPARGMAPAPQSAAAIRPQNGVRPGTQPGSVRQASATGIPQQLPRTGVANASPGMSRGPVTPGNAYARPPLSGQNPSNFGPPGAQSSVFGTENGSESRVAGLPTDRLPAGAAGGYGNGSAESAGTDTGFDPASLAGSAGEMISFSYLDGSGRQILTVIHTGKSWMAVYHIDRSGMIQLVSSREIGPDFGLLLNATSPLPDEIRQLGSPAR